MADVTAKVELSGFPPWTELEDLRAVIDGCGSPSAHVKLQYKKELGAMVAVGFFATIYDARAVAVQLDTFEFTPGYPLKAQAEEVRSEDLAPRPAPSRAFDTVAKARASAKGLGDSGGKAKPETPIEIQRRAAGQSWEAGIEYPVSNCVGAGRIEGWFVTPKEKVDRSGFGHLQSFSFEGNLVFHAEWSELLAGVEYSARDPVSFEVVVFPNGDHEAVHVALPEQEHLAPTPGEGPTPWSGAPPPSAGAPGAGLADGKVNGGKDGSYKDKGKGSDVANVEKGKWAGKKGGGGAQWHHGGGGGWGWSPAASWAVEPWGGGAWGAPSAPPGGGWSGGGWGGGGGGWDACGSDTWGGSSWSGSSKRAAPFRGVPEFAVNSWQTTEEVLRDRVKALQRKEPRGKEQWIIFTTRYGSQAATKQRPGSRQRDPKFYDEEFLQKFFDNWDNGIMLEGTPAEMQEVKMGSWAPEGAPPKRNRDTSHGMDDSHGVFFGGLLKDCTEDALRAFAETVGIVKHVQMFTDDHGNSRGCGKVFYEDPDVRDLAIKELDGLQLNGKKVAVEMLGVEPEDRKRRRLAKQGKLQETGATEEWPKLLPLSFFSETDSIEAKMDLCYAAFEDLLVTHDPEATGKGVVWMVRSIVREINDVLSDNLEAKQAFCMRLKRHPWFEENNQLVRWQESKKIINVSKISAQGESWRQWNREQRQSEREADRAKGFGGLFAGAYVNLEDANKPPERPESWGGFVRAPRD